MDALQQQRSQVGAMGGSMAGLLGQVAAGGGALGAQLAENIGQGFGLQTRQEKEAVKNQAAMKDVMSGNLVKMKNLRTKLGQTKDADPRMLMVLNQRIEEAEAKVKADIDRRRQISREEAQDAQQVIENERSAKQFGMTVAEWNQAQEDRTTATEREIKARTTTVNKLRAAGSDNIADLVENFVITPKEATTMLAESKKLGLKAADYGTYYNAQGEQITAGLDPETGTLYHTTAKGLVPIDPAGWTKGKQEGITGGGAPSKTETDSVRALITTNPEIKQMIEASTGSPGFFYGTNANPEVEDAAYTTIAGEAKTLMGQRPELSFMEATKLATANYLNQETKSEGGKSLSAEEKLRTSPKLLARKADLEAGKAVTIDGKVYRLVEGVTGWEVRDVTEQSNQQALGGNTLNMGY
jgi:hypothetical protein